MAPPPRHVWLPAEFTGFAGLPDTPCRWWRRRWGSPPSEPDALARAGRPPEPRDRARMRMDAAHATRCARRAVSLLLDTTGAWSFADGVVPQRARARST